MNRDEYYMNIAMAVRKKANCLGRKVGAVIVRENRIGSSLLATTVRPKA